MPRNHLIEPKLEPCTSREDIHCPAPQPGVGWSGYDCCNYWKGSGNNWQSDFVRTDLVHPEKFQYDKYRYQLYAKPSGFDCHMRTIAQARRDASTLSLHEPGRKYIQPTTDIRALQQTTFIPVIPTNPGGERDVTFPMTPRTMGQPDVTTACCVPVIPCQPGFQNLTPRIKPSAQDICLEEYCEEGGYHCGQAQPCQTISTPSNVTGSGCCGLPDTFPQVDMRHSLPCNAPRTTKSHQVIFNVGCEPCTDDGTAEQYQNGRCMKASTFRHRDRMIRGIEARQETDEERLRRLHTPYGHQNNTQVSMRRRVPGGHKDNILEQGNGFKWCHLEQANNQCYVLQRNIRC